MQQSQYAALVAKFEQFAEREVATTYPEGDGPITATVSDLKREGLTTDEERADRLATILNVMEFGILMLSFQALAGDGKAQASITSLTILHAAIEVAQAVAAASVVQVTFENAG